MKIWRMDYGKNLYRYMDKKKEIEKVADASAFGMMIQSLYTRYSDCLGLLAGYSIF